MASQQGATAPTRKNLTKVSDFAECPQFHKVDLGKNELTELFELELTGDGGDVRTAGRVLQYARAEHHLGLFGARDDVVRLWRDGEIQLCDNDLEDRFYCAATRAERIDAAARDELRLRVLTPEFLALWRRMFRAIDTCLKAPCCDQVTTVCGPAPEDAVVQEGMRAYALIEGSLGEFDRLRARELVLQGRATLDILAHPRVAEVLGTGCGGTGKGSVVLVLGQLARRAGRPTPDLTRELHMIEAIGVLFTWIASLADRVRNDADRIERDVIRNVAVLIDAKM